MADICLSIGSMRSTYIETKLEDWIDDPEEMGAFRFPGTEHLDSEELAEWCHLNLKVEFDGNLNNPDAFSSIKAIKLHGPHMAEYSSQGLLVEGASFYFSVTGPDEFSHENLEDLFHIIVPVIKVDGHTMAFSDFEEYEALKEMIPEKGAKISNEWVK